MSTLTNWNQLRETAEAHHTAWRRSRAGANFSAGDLRALKLVLLQAAIRSLAAQRERERQLQRQD